MKIISWNVNGLRACAKKGFFNFLKKEAPDILCLQETKVHPDQLEEGRFAPSLVSLSPQPPFPNQGKGGLKPQEGLRKDLQSRTHAAHLQGRFAPSLVSLSPQPPFPNQGKGGLKPQEGLRKDLQSRTHAAHLQGRFAPYYNYWSISETSGYSGTVIFSKMKAREVSYGVGIYQFDREGRFVIADYKDFTLFNIYFPNGSKDLIRHEFKQEFLKKLSYLMKKYIRKKKPIMIAGDYNCAYLDIDVFDPKGLSKISGFLPEERQWFRDFLSMGFIDTYRHFYPTKDKSYTWWSYRENSRKKNRGWRIDHICVSQELQSRLKSSKIMADEMSSDHCPIALTLD